MIQIKTIADALPDREAFDKKVNEAIADGWRLARRELIQHSHVPGKADYLYAELVKETITEAERCCDNCKHLDCPCTEEPCSSCGDTANKWEAAE